MMQRKKRPTKEHILKHCNGSFISDGEIRCDSLFTLHAMNKEYKCSSDLHENECSFYCPCYVYQEQHVT